MATTKLTRAFGAGNRRTWTLSLWVKRSSFSGVQCIMAQQDGWQGNGNGGIYFESGKIATYNLGDTLNSGNSSKVGTKREFRDCNAWYHLVFRQDTTQGTASDRFRIYVNGVQDTDLLYTNYPSQNVEPNFNRSTREHGIGGHQTDNSYQFDGSMSHVHFCDGYSYDASAFGSIDSTTGEWKINTSPSVSYGTTGFTVLKDGNTATDQSTNSNNFTVSGTLTKTEDCPSNVFCTANALSKGSDTVLSNGNNTARNDTNVNSATIGTIAFGNGKYYWEAYRYGGGNIGIGICLASVDGSSHSSVENGRVLYYENGSIFCNGLSDQSNITTGVTYADTDIISVSMDTENGIIKFYKNNVLVNNSTITNSKLTNSENIWVPTTYQNNGGEWRLNFGNGYFGTTAVSSAGTNASGNGIFEYDVPTGFTALSTKGLNL